MFETRRNMSRLTHLDTLLTNPYYSQVLLATTARPAFKDPKCTPILVRDDDLVVTIIERVRSCVVNWAADHNQSVRVSLVLGSPGNSLDDLLIIQGYCTMQNKNILKLDGSDTISNVRKRTPDHAACYILFCDAVCSF